MNIPVEIPKVLLIEDDSVFRMLIKRLLGDDYQIDEASSIESGRSLLSSQRYQCILLDYRLPDGTGFQMLPDAIAHDLPVVMMTAMGHEQLAIDAIKQGCQDYLIKDDLNRATLCRSLANAMRHVQSDRKTMRQRLTLQRVIETAAAKSRLTTLSLRNSGNETELTDADLEQLDHLMDGLVAYARLAASTLPAGPVTLTEVLADVRQEMKSRIANLDIEVSDKTTTTFKSDPDAINSIIRGLFDLLVEDGTSAATISLISELDRGQIDLVFAPKSLDIKVIQGQLAANAVLKTDESVSTGIEVIRLLVEQLQGTIWAEQQDDQIQIRIYLPNGNPLDGLAPK